MSQVFTANQVHDTCLSLKDENKINILQRFFKTGKGEYGEGDKFLGIPVPMQRKIAKEFRSLPIKEIEKLLQSPFHELRLIALFILVNQYEKAHVAQQEAIKNFYLQHTSYINNWDLVDSSAPQILGDWLLTLDRSILYTLAASGSLWEKRIAMVSCLAFIRKCEHEDCFAIAQILMTDKHDLIHKACGWMLREAGKKCGSDILRKFLELHAPKMPRTMLRYAIEHFEKDERKYWLSVK